MARKPTQADVAVAAFESLIARHDGQISPRILLDEARNEASPFHRYFQWDDGTAAEQYRLIQAGQLIRTWRGSVMRIDQESKTVTLKTVRRVQSPESDRGKGEASYAPIEDILSDPERREAMVHTALRELIAARRRYSELIELADVWAAVDLAAELHAPAQPKRVSVEDRPAA
jgi:hypothetical protein